MKFIRKKLKNGMTILFEKRDSKVVSLSISNPFGAIYENEINKGIAHVIEHMVFTGTKTRSHEDISREIEKKGGILNAFTANEVTSFWFKLPSEHVFSGLDIISDILLNPTFDETKFEKEKRVILEEIKMYHDDPSRAVYENVMHALYENPFGIGIIGTSQSVSSLDRKEILDYYLKHYCPSNFVVSIVGDVDIEKVCEYLEKNFPNKSSKIEKFSLKKINKDLTEEREGIDQAHLVFACHAPLQSEKDFVVLEVLNSYLAEGMSSRLFLKIREEKGLAYTVRGSLDAEKSYSYYTIYAGTRKEAIEDVKKYILEGIKDVEMMDEGDLKEAKEQIIGMKRVTSEESSKVMNELVFAEINNKAEDYYLHEERLKKVKLEDVKRVAKSLLKKYSFVSIVPK